MTHLAFHLPFASPKPFSCRPLAVTRHTRPLHSIQPVRSPPPPPSHPHSRFSRPRRTVGAWLTGHDDSAVLSAASTFTITTPHLLFGHVTHMTLSAQSAALTHVYLHIASATSDVMSHLHRCNLIPMVIHSSMSSNATSHFAPFAFTPPALAAAVTSPLLLERKDNTVVQFFQPEGDKDGTLVSETESDERPILERLIAWLTRVYLPQGFPNTTTPDYISFTKFRTLQNLASAIMQVISTEALLFGLGLGKKVAAGAAATSWVLKDGASYIVKIGYGGVFGSKFDDDPKSWRIAADVVEDIGGAIEILTPLFPLRYFLPLASLAVCLRGMSLMTGTATRHVVYRSLAASGMQNTGDIATKGESQGVTMKMIGLGTGIVVSSTIGQNYYALLATYSVLAGIHIAANWKSVQCVQFSFFNKQRASILIESHLDGKKMPNPYEVSKAEKIVMPPWRGFEPWVRMGVSVKDAGMNSESLNTAMRICKGERFLIVSQKQGSKVRVLLRDNATAEDALRAYFTVKKYVRSAERSTKELEEALKFMRKNIKSFERASVKAGWDLRHMNITDGQYKVWW